MADAPKAKGKSGDSGSDAWEAIAAFEQILEAIPNDYVALNALVHAYEMVGDHTRAKEYLLRLASQVAEQQDADAAAPLVDRIRQHAESDPSAKALADRLQKLVGARAPAPAASPAQESTTPVPARSMGKEPTKRASTVADELSFAWHLHQSGLLTQEEYASVAQDLTEVSASEAAVTVSVLHVLHDRGFRNLENVMVFSAKDSGTPVIALASFDVQKEAAMMLPLDYSIRRGVLVFDLLGNDALVALLNPNNLSLRQDVTATLGRRCHFFLVSPAEFDSAIGKLKAPDAPPAPPPAKK